MTENKLSTHNDGDKTKTNIRNLKELIDSSLSEVVKTILSHDS